MSVDSVTTYVIDVDGDDPRWQSLNTSSYYSCDSELVVEHLPVLPGRWRVSCRLLEVRDANLHGVLSAIDDRRFDHPNRAEIETLFDTFKQRPKLNLMGCCRQQRILKCSQVHYPVFQLVEGQSHVVLMPYHQYCYWVDYCIAVCNRERLL